MAEFLIAETLRNEQRLDLRMLVDKAFSDYLQYISGQAETHWKDLIRAALTERVVEVRTAIPRRTPRRALKEQEQAAVREILDRHTTREERIAAWTEATGKSERAFYRRATELGVL